MVLDQKLRCLVSWIRKSRDTTKKCRTLLDPRM